MNIIFKALVGSHAYGTNVEGSDLDYKGVYLQDAEEALNMGYKEQINVTKDEVYYELKRFIELCCTGNPTMLELLYTPSDCIQYAHPSFSVLLDHKEKFLSKMCKNSFGGYAVSQIKKSNGLDKKLNWEKGRVTRKYPLDFVYMYLDGKTMPIEKYLKSNNLKQEFCGLVALDHFKDCYAMYYDYHSQYGKEANREYKSKGYHGICRENSNEICLSSVPKDENPIGIISYNKDGYIRHCKEFREYDTWLKERNTQRYVDIEGHGHRIDGKNLLHCYRLIETGVEIATQKSINVRRRNAEYLIEIRRGKHNLETILKQSEEKLRELNEAFDTCDLPEEPDRNFLMALMPQIRQEFHGKR